MIDVFTRVVNTEFKEKKTWTKYMSTLKEGAVGQLLEPLSLAVAESV